MPKNSDPAGAHRSGLTRWRPEFGIHLEWRESRQKQLPLAHLLPVAAKKPHRALGGGPSSCAWSERGARRDGEEEARWLAPPARASGRGRASRERERARGWGQPVKGERRRSGVGGGISRE